MSKKDEALKLALEALENAEDQLAKPYSTGARYAITAIREALAEQPAQQQEPYCWKVDGIIGLFYGEFAEHDAKSEAKRIGGTCTAFPLYTSPPASKPWVGLTDNEIALVNADYPHPQGFARAIEAKLREKNT